MCKKQRFILTPFYFGPVWYVTENKKYVILASCSDVDKNNIWMF